MFPHSRSRDGISPAALPVLRAAVNLNPHYPPPKIRTLRDACSPDCVALYRTSRDWHLPLLLLPQWSAALSPPSPAPTTTTNFSTLTLFYAELAALPMCIIPPFLLTGRENDEEDELTTTVAGTKRKLEDYHWKCYFFLFLSLSASLILCYDATVDLSHRDYM